MQPVWRRRSWPLREQQQRAARSRHVVRRAARRWSGGVQRTPFVQDLAGHAQSTAPGLPDGRGRGSDMIQKASVLFPTAPGPCGGLALTR